jgi:hypothetical protein
MTLLYRNHYCRGMECMAKLDTQAWRKSRRDRLFASWGGALVDVLEAVSEASVSGLGD